MAHLIQDVELRKAEGGSYTGGYAKYTKKVQTTDATATDVDAIPLAEGEAVVVRVLGAGKKSDLTAASGLMGWGVARRAASGNVTLVGSAQGTAQEDHGTGTPAFSFAADTTAQTVDVRVTGIASETWSWEVTVEYQKV